MGWFCPHPSPPGDAGDVADIFAGVSTVILGVETLMPLIILQDTGKLAAKRDYPALNVNSAEGTRASASQG